MLNRDSLTRALFDITGEPYDVTRIEFEVLDTGAGRWIMWDGERRLFTGIINSREELVTALQASSVILRTTMLVRQTPDSPH